MNSRFFFLLACGYSGLLLGLVGCERRALQVSPQEAPVVPVSKPVAREVTDYIDFTGRTQAVKSVNVVARATGYLIQEPFKEGSEVKAGDLLFEIDPKPYRAQYNQALGQVNLYKAQLKLAQATLARDEQLARNTPGAVSALQLDQDRAATDEADAQVKASLASLDVYKQNLDFTRVTSPIDGQVSRYYLTLGNLVSQDQTLLTTVVSLDPMYAYVDVDEPTVLRVRRAINRGEIKPYSEGQIPILMQLDGEENFPRKGVVDFVNNQVNPTTGSILARGRFDNSLPPGGRRLLLPGMFVRIRLPIGKPHPALLVIDRAILSDQDKKFVYVVDAEGKVQYRRIMTGPLESDGLRVITEGLKPDDLVVVGALQQVRPHMSVKAEPTSMLSLTDQGTGGTASQ
ncbi:MAG: efflux RND transporter periplasmic adaptor subunit [Thermoguttaceae bacterium]